MIRIWVEPARITPGGRPVVVRTPAGEHYASQVELRDARGDLVATVRYSRQGAPNARTRVWIDLEPLMHVVIDGRSPDVAVR